MAIQEKWIWYKHWANKKRRPHHEQGLSPPNHWKFPPPAMGNLPSHHKRSYKTLSSRDTWMELTTAWPKWKAGALTTYKMIFPFCPVYLKFPAITPAWIQQTQHQLPSITKLTRTEFLTHLWWAQFRDKSKWKQRLLQAWRIWTALCKEANTGTWNKYY